MKKITVWLLCFCIVYVSSVTAFAQTISQDGTRSSAVISVTVPDSHTLTVSAEHAQVLYGGQWDESFSVERLSEPTLLIRPEDGYKVTRVTLNGEDVTAQVQGGYYPMGPVYEEKALVVETKAVPTNSDSIHDISGTVTNEVGDPIPGAVVDIGGKTGTTDEDGKFTISGVTDGYHPVTITDEDGNVIGYTEIEIIEGEPGVTKKPDGSYTLTAPEDADLSLELTLTAAGRISVDSLADITPEQSGPGPQTGDDGNLLIWSTMRLISSGILFILLLAKKQKKSE